MFDHTVDLWWLPITVCGLAMWRFLAQNFNRRTELELSTKLSYEVLQPPLRKTAVSGSAFYPDIYLPNGNLFTPQIIKVEKTKHKTLVIGIPIIGLIKA